MSKAMEREPHPDLVRDRVQIRNPLTGRYVKVDTTTGRIVASKKTPGKFARVREIPIEK